jgi:hypothetical protein
VVVFLLAVNVALIISYSKCANKEMEEDIGFQVSSKVSEYIAPSQNSVLGTKDEYAANTSIEL